MNDWNMKVSEPWNRVFKHPDGYLEGCVITAHGIVYVYSQGGMKDGIKDVPHTTMQFVQGGRVYNRGIDKRYTKRGLVTIAHRFAKEVSGDEA